MYKKSEEITYCDNPIEIMWDLLKIPEEERIKTAHLFDYCEEEILIEG